MWYSIFCLSSQLEGGAEIFKRTILKNKDSNFKLRSRSMNTTGKKFLLLFTAFKFGTPQTDICSHLRMFLRKRQTSVEEMSSRSLELIKGSLIAKIYHLVPL